MDRRAFVVLAVGLAAVLALPAGAKQSPSDQRCALVVSRRTGLLLHTLRTDEPQNLVHHVTADQDVLMLVAAVIPDDDECQRIIDREREWRRVN